MISRDLGARRRRVRGGLLGKDDLVSELLDSVFVVIAVAQGIRSLYREDPCASTLIHGSVSL